VEDLQTLCHKEVYLKCFDEKVCRDCCNVWNSYSELVNSTRTVTFRATSRVPAYVLLQMLRETASASATGQ